MKFRIKSSVLELSLLILILLGGFLVRTWHLTSPIADWHSWRQVDTASVSRIYLTDGVNVLKPRYYDISRIQTGMLNKEGLRMVEFPFYNLTHVYLEKTFHLEKLPALRFSKTLLSQKKLPFLTELISVDSFVVWGRFVTIGCSLIAAFFLYLIAKNTINSWAGLLAAFFYLFIPFNIYFTRVILPEPLGVAALLISLYFFLRYIKKEKSVWLVISAVFFAIATLIKPFMFVYALPLIYLVVTKFGIKGVLKKTELYIYGLLAITPFFLWRMWVNKYIEGIPAFDWAFNGDKIRFKPAFWYWIFGERIGKLILGIWGIIPFAFGLINSTRDKFFGFTFFVGSLVYVTTIATASVRHDYYQILVIPTLAYLLSLGVVEMWNTKVGNKVVSRIVVTFSVFMMLLMGYYQVRDFYQINHPEIIDAGQAVKRLTPKDALVIAPYNGDTAFLYNTERFGWPVVDESLEEMIKRGADYYVSVDFAGDTNYVMNKWKILEKTSKYVIVDLNTPKE